MQAEHSAHPGAREADRRRHERIDGEEVVPGVPSTRHQRIVRRLLVELDDCVERTSKGEVFVAPLPVTLSEDTVVLPDVFFVSVQRASLVEPHGVAGAPDLVAEVVSEESRRRDEVDKRALYERHDVRQYWVVDPHLGTIKDYRMTPSGYVLEAEVSADVGHILVTPLLPGLEIDLAHLFS